MRYVYSLSIVLAVISGGHPFSFSAEPWQDASEIRLKDIWALEMPGTRDLRRLGSPAENDSPIEKVLKLIREADWPENGLAVEGEGLAALEEFYRRRSEGFSWNNVSPNVPVSLVFFTGPTDWDVNLVKVQHKGQRFRVWYQFAPAATAAPRQHLALIPVGKLADDQYWVTFERLPMDQRHLDAGAAEPSWAAVNALMCGSFSFQALDKEAAALAGRRTIIPLSNVWAWEMPGTQDINKLDPGDGDQSLITQLRRSIRETWNHDPALAVSGEGLDALREFHRIRVEKAKPKPLTDDAPISLVFFTDAAGPYVHIHQIERTGNRFTVRYRPVPHDSHEMTRYIALIPVGTLRFGKYVVTIERSPMEPRYIERGNREPAQDFGGRVVSHSFQFLVSRRR
jgi:hypothetical protein